MQIAPKPDALIMLGEFGLVLMVLEAGVEVDLQQLAHVGQRGVAVAFAGSLAPLAIGATLGHLVFGMNVMSSLAVGASLAPTSMGISLKVLQDGGVLGTPTGQLIIAAAVLDDVIALVLLSELEALKHPSTVDFIIPIVSSACFIVVVGYCAVRVVPDVLVRRVVPRVAKENVEGLLLGLVFVVAYALMVVLHYGRSSHLLGAFLGGLCFCSLSSMQHTWHVKVEKILSWLVRVFFACTIGFEVPIRDLWTGPVLARAGVFLVAALGKIATGLFAKPLTRVEAMKIGFAMSAWGEFAFIVATASREAGTMSSVDYSAVILAVLLSTVYSPYAVKYAIELDKANIIKREDRASIVRMDDVEEGLPSAFAMGPGGETVVMHRVYYVCVVEVPSRWGLYDAVFKAMRDASVDMEVLDVSIKPRAGWGLCELFLRDPKLRAPRTRRCRAPRTERWRRASARFRRRWNRSCSTPRGCYRSRSARGRCCWRVGCRISSPRTRRTPRTIRRCDRRTICCAGAAARDPRRERRSTASSRVPTRETNPRRESRPRSSANDQHTRVCSDRRRTNTCFARDRSSTSSTISRSTALPRMKNCTAPSWTARCVARVDHARAWAWARCVSTARRRRECAPRWRRATSTSASAVWDASTGEATTSETP